MLFNVGALNLKIINMESKFNIKIIKENETGIFNTLWKKYITLPNNISNIN